MEAIRILYINGGIMNRGGIESYMMNYYRHIDRDKVQIDFVVHGFEKGAYDNEILSLGGKIYNIPIKSKDYFGNLKALREIFLSGNYKIVHSHMDAMSAVALKEAKKCGIPIRIAHSHNTQHLTNNKIKFLLNEYARKNIKKYTTNLFACSEEAGRWLFGDKSVNDGKVKIVNNAIDIEKFKFNNDMRNKLRKELGIVDNFVIGHVGRFDYQKNHLFLIDIFKETLKYISNAKLVLVGDGHLRKDILSRISELNIEDSVILLGVRDDVNNINNIFDLFILPSLFEGLPVVAIEAQANGVYCIMSDSITKEVKVTKNIELIQLNNNYEKWIESIVKSKKYIIDRKDSLKYISNNGYDIKEEARKLEEFYINLV